MTALSPSSRAFLDAASAVFSADFCIMIEQTRPWILHPFAIYQFKDARHYAMRRIKDHLAAL
jgi:hypothetical protein